MAFEQSEVKKKPVVITDVTIKPFGGSLSYIIDTNGGKFSFFNKKKNGEETKAFQQFVKFGFKKGDSVEIAYTEKVSDTINSFTGKPYVNYTIIFFVTAGEHTPSTPSNLDKNQNISSTIHDGIPTINLDDESRVPTFNKEDDEQKINDSDVKIADLAKRVRAIEEFLDIKNDGLNISDVPF